MSFKDKFSNFFFLEDEETERQAVFEPKKPKNNQETANMNVRVNSSTDDNRSDGKNKSIVPINSANKQKPKIKVMEPRLYSEAKDIADLVLDNQTVILNFRRMENEQASQMLNFMSGVVYSKNGDLQKIGDKMFVCTPDSVELDGLNASDFNNQNL